MTETMTKVSGKEWEKGSREKISYRVRKEEESTVHIYPNTPCTYANFVPCGIA